MKKKTELLIYSIALLVIALCNLGMLVMDFNAGAFEMVTHEDALVEKVTNIILMVLLGCGIISIIANAYLGVKGIVSVVNLSHGRLHIFIAKLIGTFNLVLTVIVGLSLLNSTDLASDFKTFLLCLVDVILMYSYAKAAKAVRNGEE